MCQILNTALRRESLRATFKYLPMPAHGTLSSYFLLPQSNLITQHPLNPLLPSSPRKMTFRHGRRQTICPRRCSIGPLIDGRIVTKKFEHDGPESNPCPAKAPSVIHSEALTTGMTKTSASQPPSTGFDAFTKQIDIHQHPASKQ
jgi:hypothetical protein